MAVTYFDCSLIIIKLAIEGTEYRYWR